MDLFAGLQLVLDLVEHGSFSAVAALRNQAPSSVSRRLDALEENLDERLFNRTANGVFLTDAGKRRLPEIQNLNASVTAFLEPEPNDGQLRGSVSVAAPNLLGRDYIVPVVSEFLSSNPDASFDLHFTDAVQDLDRDGIDVAVRVAAKNPGHHIIRRIASNRRILVMSPHYLKTVNVTELADLSGLRVISMRNRHTWRMQHDDGTEVAVDVTPTIQCLSADSALKLCVQGLGVCLRSYIDSKPYLERGELVHLFPEWQEAGASQVVSLVLPDRRLLSKTVTAFSQLLTQRLKETLPL